MDLLESIRRAAGPSRIGLVFLCVLYAFSIGAAQAEVPSKAPVRDRRNTFAQGVSSWMALKTRNVVMQKRDYSCGAAALATLIKYYWGDPVTEELFLKELGEMLTPEEGAERVKNGLAMSDLRRVAVRTGYQAAVGKLTFDKLTEAKVPLIVGLSVNDYDHFVVYRGTFEPWVYLADPIRGNIRILASDFVDQWQDHAVLAVHKPGAKVRDVSPLSVRLDEIELGQLNQQLIRRPPGWQPFYPPRPTGR